MSSGKSPFTLSILGPFSPKAIVALDDSSVEGYFSTWSEASPINAQIRNLSAHVDSIVAMTFSRTCKEIQISQFNNITFFVLPLRKVKHCVLDNYKVERNLGRKILEGFPIDLVHAHWTYEYALLALDFDRSALITVHDNPWRVFRFFRDKLRFYKLFQALLVRSRCNQSNLVFVSNALAKSWRKNLIYLNKLTVIPNFNRMKPISCLPSRKKQNFLAMGNSSRLKNIETLLSAFQLSLQRFPDSILHLCGDGLEYGSTLEQTWRHKVGDSVKWHGQVDLNELQSLLLEVSIYIHPSLEETQGMAVVEAMSLGLPVIVHEKIPALKETCGEAAFYVDCTSPQKLNAKICELLASDLDLKKIAERNINQVNIIFDTQKTVEKTLSLYKSRNKLRND